MQPKAVLEALILELEQNERPNVNIRILVAASLEILKELANEMNCPQFDMNSDMDKAFLLRAVSKINPNAEFTDDDRDVIQLLNEVSPSQTPNLLR